MKLMLNGINILTLTVQDCLELQAYGCSVAFNDGGRKISLEKEKSH